MADFKNQVPTSNVEQLYLTKSQAEKFSGHCIDTILSVVGPDLVAGEKSPQPGARLWLKKTLEDNKEKFAICAKEQANTSRAAREKQRLQEEENKQKRKGMKKNGALMTKKVIESPVFWILRPERRSR